MTPHYYLKNIALFSLLWLPTSLVFLRWQWKQSISVLMKIIKNLVISKRYEWKQLLHHGTSVRSILRDHIFLNVNIITVFNKITHIYVSPDKKWYKLHLLFSLFLPLRKRQTILNARYLFSLRILKEKIDS